MVTRQGGFGFDWAGAAVAAAFAALVAAGALELKLKGGHEGGAQQEQGRQR